MIQPVEGFHDDQLYGGGGGECGSFDRDDLDSSSKLDPDEPDLFENSGKFVITEGSEEIMF